MRTGTPRTEDGSTKGTSESAQPTTGKKDLTTVEFRRTGSAMHPSHAEPIILAYSVSQKVSKVFQVFHRHGE